MTKTVVWPTWRASASDRSSDPPTTTPPERLTRWTMWCSLSRATARLRAPGSTWTCTSMRGPALAVNGRGGGEAGDAGGELADGAGSDLGGGALEDRQAASAATTATAVAELGRIRRLRESEAAPPATVRSAPSCPPSPAACRRACRLLSPVPFPSPCRHLASPKKARPRAFPLRARGPCLRRRLRAPWAGPAWA